MTQLLMCETTLRLPILACQIRVFPTRVRASRCQPWPLPQSTRINSSLCLAHKYCPDLRPCLTNQLKPILLHLEMPPTNSRRKRPFQPSSQKTLDAFVSRQSSLHQTPSLFPSASAPEPSIPSPSEGFPTQPPSIQASLLHVGLRVRKSVPEGYKTHKTLGLDAYDDENTDTLRTDVETAPSASAPELSGGSRELEPYCGIHRVGGYGMQSSSQLSVPSLVFSSQESRTSTGSASSVGERGRNEKKREREGDYDDDLLDEALGVEEKDEDFDENPVRLSFAKERQKMPLNRGRSPFGAGLRGRQQVARKPTDVVGLGGEGPMLVDDFPEADFLRPAEDMDIEE